MSLWGRLRSLFRMKASKALDRVEDPRETLDYSYERQLDLMQEMRRGVAEVATSRKRIELQADRLRRSDSKLEGQALQALEQNREDLAREALTRREAIQSELEGLRAQQEQLRAEEDKMVEAARRLEAKIHAFRSRKETMKAAYAAAEAQTRVGEAVTGISKEMGDLGRSMQRAEDRIAQMQARAGAIEELSASGALDDITASNDRIQAELDAAVSQGSVDLELARLKNQLGSGERAALEASDSDDST